MRERRFPMRPISVLLLLSLVAAVPSAFAQQTLPTTDVRSAPKPRPVAHRTIVRPAGVPTLSPLATVVPGASTAEQNMSDGEFQAFQARHPTAVYIGRCYSGMDPDPNIRTQLFRSGSINGCM
jgi:hypothetical protein